MHFDTEALELLARLVSQLFGEGGQHARPGLDEQDARLARIDVAKVAGQRVPRDFRERAREFRARGSGADHGEREAGIAFGRIGGGFRLFECGQHAAPDQERVVERLEPGGKLLPLIVSEVGVRGATRDEKVVVGNLAIGQRHLPRGGVDAEHVAHVHGDVALVSQDVAQRRGDRRRGEAGRGHLVEQGLEQMMIAAIDQRDLDRRSLELAYRPQTGESTTDDDDSLCI